MGFSLVLMILSGALVVLMATLTLADVNTDFDKLKSRYLPPEYAAKSFTLDDAKRLLRQKCRKAAGGVDNPDVYEDIERAAVRLVECANGLANLTQVQAEMDEARPRGELDVVFQKYCSKRPQAEQCLVDFNAHVLPCLSPEERAQNGITMRIISSLLGFVCYKNGDQLAFFIAERGPECIEANKEHIVNCFNATLALYKPEQIAENVIEMPELVLGPKQCFEFHEFEQCVIGYLERCEDVTPASIVEAIFKYVKHETKCLAEIEQVNKLKRLDLGRSSARGNVGMTLAADGLVLAVMMFVIY